MSVKCLEIDPEESHGRTWREKWIFSIEWLTHLCLLRFAGFKGRKLLTLFRLLIASDSQSSVEILSELRRGRLSPLDATQILDKSDSRGL
jgi:hypothetical protein